jgi:glyceraldehyde 3-phosphate dehydrogenase
MGAARAVGLLVPEPAGALDGIAVRVPVDDGSLTDLAPILDREAGVDEINEAFATAAEGPLGGILPVSKAPIGTLVKVFGWHDNEWGRTDRLRDLTSLVADD